MKPTPADTGEFSHGAEGAFARLRLMFPGREVFLGITAEGRHSGGVLVRGKGVTRAVEWIGDTWAECCDKAERSNTDGGLSPTYPCEGCGIPVVMRLTGKGRQATRCRPCGIERAREQSRDAASQRRADARAARVKP